MANEEGLRDYLKLAIADLRQAHQRLRELAERSQEPIAIVAIGYRFPRGVEDLEDLWRLAAEGTDVISGLPGGRGWNAADIWDSGAVAGMVPGRTAAGLRAQAGRLAARPHLDPAGIGYPRTSLEHRAVITGTGHAELTTALTAVAAGQPAAALTIGTATHGPRTAFVFAGRGNQRAGMG